MIKCKRCGKENENNNWRCVSCGDLLHEEIHRRTVKPKNFIVLSVLMILSLIPTAIISFVYGLKVNSSFTAGEFDKAEEYSKKARLWTWISLGIGVIFLVISFVYFIRIFNEISPLINSSIGGLM